MILEFFIILFLILILDMVWFTFSLNTYKKQIQDVQKSELTINKTSALIAYLLIAFGLLMVINIKKYDKKTDLIVNCALFGLLTYGIYNSTSMAIYKDYPVKVAVIDTVWGTLLGTIVGTTFAYF